MSNFTAIDFETATGDRNSICQVGLVIVEQCKIIDRISYLVQPPRNLYSDRCIEIHGITPDKTAEAPTFDKIWQLIEKHINKRRCVAHSAQFEISCLTKVLQFYKISQPAIEWYCTKSIYKSSLAVACAVNGIATTKQHDALSDAEACALLMIKDIQR